MASFSVDITNIVFAGGRTGSKVITISNRPSSGITVAIRGTNSTYFRTAVVESGVSYTISTKQINDTGSTRTAYVRFTNKNNSADYVDVNLKQYSISNNMELYADGATYVDAGNYTINVSNQMGSIEVLLDAASENGASGSVISGSDWLSSVSGTPAVSDTGFLRFNASYITNTDSERTGKIQYVSNSGWINTLTVVQAGEASTQVLSVTPSELSYDSSGGNMSITVTYRGDTFNYDASSVSSWVSVSLSKVVKGVMKGTVSVSPNDSSSQRTGNIVFSDASGSINLPISQEGVVSSLSVSPTSLSFISGGETKTLAVSFSGNLTTNDTEMPSWLQYSYVTVDDTHRTYTITASANNTSSVREFNFELQDENMTLTVPISQSAGSSQVEKLSFNPTSILGTSSAGSFSIKFFDTYTSDNTPVPDVDIKNISYSISDSWVTFVRRWSETGNQYGNYSHMDFKYSANQSLSPRKATITFSTPGYASEVFEINQDGQGSGNIVISPQSKKSDYKGGSFNITSNVSDLTVYVADSWITNTSGSSTVYSFSYGLNNSSSSRTGTITFSKEGYDPVVFVLTQEGIPGNLFELNVDSIRFNYLGGYMGDGICSFKKRDWNGTIYPRYVGDAQIPITYDSSITSSDYYFNYSIPAGTINDTFSSFSGRIEFYTAETGGVKIGEVPVYMDAAPKNITVLPDVVAFISGGILAYRELPVFVSAVGEVTVSAPSWITVTLLNENSTYKTYKVRCRDEGDGLDGYIRFTSSDGNIALIYVKCTISDSTCAPMPIIFPLEGGKKNVMFSSKLDLRDNSYIDSAPDWIDYDRNNYTSNINKRFNLFTLTASSTSSDRSGTITFHYFTDDIHSNDRKQRVTVRQEAGVLNISPKSMSFSSKGGSDTAYITYTGSLNYDAGSLPSWISIEELSYESGKKTYKINVQRNTGDTRSYNILFQDDNNMITLPVVQDVGAPAIIVSPNSNVVGEGSGVVSVNVNGPSVINCNISGSWMRLNSHSGNIYTFIYDANKSGSSRSSTVVFSADGYLPATYTLTQAAGLSLKASSSKLKFHKNADTKKISFSNVPSGKVDYMITYIDGSGWLSVDGTGLLKNVSVDDNFGSRRRAEIKFVDYDNSSNFVIVSVIQGGEGYDSIWVDNLFYPSSRDVDGSYYYRVVDQEDNKELFRGVSVKPQMWGGNVGGIDIPRLVEDNLYSDFSNIYDLGSWEKLSGYCTVDIYNMTASGYPGVLDKTYKFWNDWSGYEEVYDYTVCINDPINGKGCDNMIIPFCVYYDDIATFSIIEKSNNGSVNIDTMPTPGYPFAMTYGSFNSLDKLEFMQDDDVVFSYDMKHCGSGAFVYRNRFGGWDSFLIEGNIIKTDNYTKQNYRKKGEYNSRKIYNFDEKVTDSVSINTTYEAYTGWLTDEQAERLVFHLLSSPIVYFQNFTGDLYDTDQFTLTPVRLTASSAEYKKFRNGKKMVNYLITFEKGNIEKVRN